MYPRVWIEYEDGLSTARQSNPAENLLIVLDSILPRHPPCLSLSWRTKKSRKKK